MIYSKVAEPEYLLNPMHLQMKSQTQEENGGK
jgi:hypothetical protein